MSRDSYMDSFKNSTKFTDIDDVQFLGDGNKRMLKWLLVAMHAILDDHLWHNTVYYYGKAKASFHISVGSI